MGNHRMKVGLDTSCLVPLFLDEHTRHEVTWAEWERLQKQNVQWVVPCHAILECFSVLTRMPPPYRREPQEAERMLRDNFEKDAAMPGLDSEVTWEAIRTLTLIGAGGGIAYDAVIARSTWSAGATVLLTWNVDDFLRVAPPGLEVATPEEHAARGPRVH